MAYNKKKLLKRIVEIQNIVLEELDKGYLTQRDIFDKIIEPKYHISIRTFQNYLGRNAKKELADMKERLSVDIKELATKTYGEQRLSIEDAAKELGITHYKMREVIRRYDLKTKRHDALLARNDGVRISKEQNKIDRYLRIIEIQELSNGCSGMTDREIYNKVIQPKYGISMRTYTSYLNTPAKEELEAIRKRDVYREQANEYRRQKGII